MWEHACYVCWLVAIEQSLTPYILCPAHLLFLLGSPFQKTVSHPPATWVFLDAPPLVCPMGHQVLSSLRTMSNVC